MRLGESNIRHFEDSDLQILGFRFQIGRVKGLEIQQNAVKHSVLQQLLRLCSLGPKIVFPKQQFSLQHSNSIRSIWKGIYIKKCWRTPSSKI